MAKSNDILSYRTTKTYGQPNLALSNKQVPDDRARFAMAIIERWALVSATPDGEDSAGRQKLKLTPEPEIVKRAFALADLAWQETLSRDWFIDIPESAYEEAEKQKAY